MKLRMSLATDAALASITQWSSSGYSFTHRFGTHLSSPPRCPDRIAVSFMPQITSVGVLMIVVLAPCVTSSPTTTRESSIVRLDTLRPRRQVVAAHVEADRRVIATHLRHLILPLVPERRIAVQEQDERSLTHARVMQAQAVHLGVAVLKLGARSLRAGRCGNAQHHSRRRSLRPRIAFERVYIA